MSLAEVKQVAKPWGSEVVFAVTRHYGGKILTVRAGHRLSLQFHKVREKTLYVLSGEIRLLIENEQGAMEEVTLQPGQAHHVAANRKHRIEAVSDSDIIEVSTPHPDDIVRLEDNYGRAPDSGSAQ